MAPRRSWTKANNPYWSTHVETWYGGHQEPEELPPAQAFDRDVQAVGVPFGEPGGSAQTCGTSAEIALERAGTAGQEKATEAAQEACALSIRRAHGQRF